MQVIQELNDIGLNRVVEKYKLCTPARHPKYPNLVLLKYNQIESPMGERVSQECRGLILDEENGWNVVSRSYDRFFNDGEGHAAKIDWNTAKVYEKLDGSIITLYRYNNHWNVQTSGNPAASGGVADLGITFEELFWTTWRYLGYKLPEDWGCVFIFELMTPENRVVVPHSKPRIVLHGVRSVMMIDGYSEFDPEGMAAMYGWEVCQSYPLQSMDDVVEAARKINPMQSEGFVIRDANFNRVKVKSPQYVAIHHMKDSFCDRRMIELVRANEGDEFLKYFPEYKPLFDKYSTKHKALVKETQETYEKIKHIENQKEFALEAVKCKCSGALFCLRGKKVESIHQYLNQISVQNLEEMLSKC